MRTETLAFMFAMFGLLLTMFGVGGVENSITNTELLQSVSVSVLGLLLMWSATVMLKHTD